MRHLLLFSAAEIDLTNKQISRCEFLQHQSMMDHDEQAQADAQGATCRKAIAAMDRVEIISDASNARFFMVQ